MTSTEHRLSWVVNMIEGYPYQPKSPEEAEGGYWFFETGKGWFLGDKGWTNDRIIDEDECERGVNGSIGAFQATGQSSNLCVRSKKNKPV